MARKKSHRKTRQRQVILEELSKLGSHPSAAKLYEVVRQRLPKISLGTVYRNLELLTQNGTIQKLALSGTQSRFDANVQQHYHVRCVRCGRVDDVDETPADLPGDRFKSLNGYEITGCRLEFIGICPGCKTLSATEDSETPRPAGD